MKVFAFNYNPLIHESGDITISLHSTFEGAQAAMNTHKADEKKSWYSLYVPIGQVEVDDKDEEPYPFGSMSKWSVNPVQVLTDEEPEKYSGMLKSFQDYLDNTPKEELEKVWADIEAMGLEGPTVEEYFQGISPQHQYAKGYREGAKKFKTEIENELKNDEKVLIPITELLTLMNTIFNTK